MDSKPFICLGFDAKGRYHFRVTATGLTLRLRAERMSQRALIRLAPVEFWRQHFRKGRTTDWDAAVDKLLRACEAAGKIAEQITHLTDSGMDRIETRARMTADNVVAISRLRELNRLDNAAAKKHERERRKEWHASLAKKRIG